MDQPITEMELRNLEERYKHWEEIPKGQFPCSWNSLGLLLKAVRVRDAEIERLNKMRIPLRRLRPRSKKQKIEDDLRQSDLTAQLTDRQDIEYGHHDSLPRGEHVANRRGPTQEG